MWIPPIQRMESVYAKVCIPREPLIEKLKPSLIDPPFKTNGPKGIKRFVFFHMLKYIFSEVQVISDQFRSRLMMGLKFLVSSCWDVRYLKSSKDRLLPKTLFSYFQSYLYDCSHPYLLDESMLTSESVLCPTTCGGRLLFYFMFKSNSKLIKCTH